MGYVGAERNKVHLVFIKLPRVVGKKTDIYNITRLDYPYDTIGIIHWRGGWRQYVSQTLPQVDMSRGCNLEVNAFIDKLMNERKKNV